MLSLWGGAVEPPCLLDSFRRQAAARPDRTAVVDEHRSVTYAELLNWVQAVAGTLREAGVVAGERVAVTGSRGTSVVAALLGTLWAGATYVPLDNTYPVKRLAHMLSDSDARLLLHDGTPIPLESPVPHREIPAPGADGMCEPVACDASLPTYLIYTSGSTGLPKGVAVPHRCLDAMVEWQRSHSVRPDLRTAQFAPLNFDVSFQEVLGTLCGGGTLVVVPERLRQDPFDLLDWLHDHRIERLFLPYVALQMLAVASAADEEVLDGMALVEVNAAGEQLVCTPDIRQLFERLADCRLNNHYGQSESAMVTAFTLTGPSRSWPALPPIGSPLPGCEVLVDPEDPADPAVGELLVAGAPLSSGYLNQPELSAARYTTIPPSPQGHRSVFRTGDLVRLADGVLYFLGRRDKEIKIRGYRVNLLEIEAQLLDLAGVRNAVCVVQDNGEGSKSVHAVVTLEPGAGPLSAASAHAALGEVLPEAFLPRTVTTVPDLPRIPSGKIDRDAVALMLLNPAGTAS
ncbi:AMP-binding protein [Streptomyces anulatus]